VCGLEAAEVDEVVEVVDPQLSAASEDMTAMTSRRTVHHLRNIISHTPLGIQVLLYDCRAYTILFFIILIRIIFYSFLFMF